MITIGSKDKRSNSEVKPTMSTSYCHCETLSLRIAVILCSTLLVAQASPAHRTDHLPEKILFAMDGSRPMRNMQGHGHRRHVVVSPSGAEVVQAFEGQDVVLECEAASRSGPSIHWLHRGHRIPQAADGMFEEYDTDLGKDVMTGSTRSKLFLNCVSPKDVGDYICVADTPTGRNISVRTLVVDQMPQENRDRRMSIGSRAARRAFKGKSPSCERKSNENDAAKIFLWSKNKLVLEDSDIRLLCRASGSPQPQIVWLDRNEKPITDADEQYQILKNGDLVIRKTTWKQNMGLYQCVADNGNGVDTASTFVFPAARENQK